MPWSIPNLMSTRLEFVAEALLQRRRMAALCAAYGISEKTGYKWLARFRGGGPGALDDASHAPHGCPHATPAHQREILCQLRLAHPTWGARKLRAVARDQEPQLRWPALSTITTVLHQAGLIRARRRRPLVPGAPPPGPLTAAVPNGLWTMDYKGQFTTGDGHACYPLTIVDSASRFLLACEAHRRPTTAAVQAVLTRCFHTYGLPDAILSDNGPPFGAAAAPRRFSRVSLRLATLGIRPLFIAPGHPEQNGRHERMHRTLKADVPTPPARSCASQQSRFDAFRAEYNTLRPHEALGLTPPARHYHQSARAMPARLAPLVYAPHLLVRRVAPSGVLNWHQQQIYVSLTYGGYDVGLDPVSAIHYDVYFMEYLLGTLDVHALRFRPLTQVVTSPINPV